MDSISDFYSGGNSNSPRQQKTRFKTCSVCGTWVSGDRCANGCGGQPAPELPPPTAAPQQIAAILISHGNTAAQVFTEAAAEFLGLPRGSQIFRGKRFDLIPFRVPSGRNLADRTALGWKGLFLFAGKEISPALAEMVSAQQLPLLPDWLPEPFVRVVEEQIGLVPRRLTIGEELPAEASAAVPVECGTCGMNHWSCFPCPKGCSPPVPPPVGTPPKKNIHAEEAAPLPPRPKRLPRRKPDQRQPHHFCRNLQSGLFRDRRVEGDSEHIVLTHSCGKPSRCNPCAIFDRDRRYADFRYALEFESSTIQLYYFQTDNDKVWSAFRAHQRRAAKRSGDEMRRWESREGAPDGGTIYRVVTPIPHPAATPLGRGEADEIVRRECDDLHTRGARRTTVRCWGSWRQERPEPRFERLCRSIDDAPEIEDFLKSIAVDFEIKLSTRGTLYRTLMLRYDSDAQRDAVRGWFAERDRQRRMSRSTVSPPERNTREGWQRYFAQFDDAFEDFGRRRTG